MVTALRRIQSYTENKKPATLEEAQHMLNLINVIVGETIGEKKEAA